MKNFLKKLFAFRKIKNISKTLDILEKRAKGEGQFKYDLNTMKDFIMENYRGKNKEYAWGNVKARLIYDINAYRSEHNGMDPDRALVAQWGREALVNGSVSYAVQGKLFGENVVKTDEAEAAAHGIMRVVDNPSGGKFVTLKDGRTVTLTDAQLAMVFEQNLAVEEAAKKR